MWTKEKFSREYYVVGNGKTNRPSEKGLFSGIQLFRERLSEKSIKVHATRPKGGLGIHWNFAY